MTRLLAISTAKRAVVEYELPPSLPPVSGDLAQIQQVVMNLVINAAEAIEGGKGLIRVRAGSMHCDREYLLAHPVRGRPAGGQLRVVRGHGQRAGMDDETLEKIFDPFFSTKFPGRGLGLAAVAGILRGHKGAIHVQSEPGRGATFRILFPAAAAAAVEKKPAPPRGGSDASRS